MNPNQKKILSYAAFTILLVLIVWVLFYRIASKTGMLPVTPTEQADWRTYQNDAFAFKISYPPYLETGLAQKQATSDYDGLDARMFRASFPDKYQPGTNLRAATVIAGAKKVSQYECWQISGNDPDLYGSGKSHYENISIHGMPFRRVTVSDAGAGNVYVTYRYATFWNDTCYLLSLVAHSNNLGILQETDSTIKQYDQAALSAVFDKIVATFETLTPVANNTNPVVTLPLKTYDNQEYGIFFKYPGKFDLATPGSLTWRFPDETLAQFSYRDVSKEHATVADTITLSWLPIPRGISPEQVLIEHTFYDGSGANPKSFDEFKSVRIGGLNFYKIRTGTFEGVLGMHYYLIHDSGVFVFSLNSHGVPWTEPGYDPDADARKADLEAMLATVQLSE